MYKLVSFLLQLHIKHLIYRVIAFKDCLWFDFQEQLAQSTTPLMKIPTF